MGLIEQAAKRLDQLRRAGVEIPEPVGRQIPVAGLNDGARAEVRPAKRHSGEEVSKHIELNIAALEQAGFVTPASQRSQISSEFRVVKRPLIANALGKGAVRVANGNLIMVTSAVPSEGKTFTAINLAISIAMEMDVTVMLVDADVAHPSVPRVLGIEAGPGLLDVVLDRSLDLSSVLLKTNIEKLTLLPAGTPHAKATEILASEALIALLAEMGQRYEDRIIIFDSPPLLVTTEARVLASHMGQIVMVTRAGQTLHSEVTEALATIDECPVKFMVLNQALPDPLGSYGYGYGYGFGYGYGQKSGEGD